MIGHELIVWNEELVTGVSEIDEQHRILVNSINEVNTRLSSTSVSAEILEKITQDLLSYALYHFETEESLMQEFNYLQTHGEDLAIHQRQHRDFSATVVSVREDIKTGKLISREDLLSFLNSWLINHILNTDKRLGAFILEKRKELKA
ncbi:Bacteriohemerythrin [Methylococcales bacterium]|uniref:bacteriohemerythrin n=1 Tax=Methylomonas sp. LL1 TaxID=2785785 RepID=UPI001AC3F034|nr:bacteriohemerythrin [Methylomonas sp. LL1]CAG1021017.1 Bacteriohemerythrin [Methylococcales bacterium]